MLDNIALELFLLPPDDVDGTANFTVAGMLSAVSLKEICVLTAGGHVFLRLHTDHAEGVVSILNAVCPDKPPRAMVEAEGYIYNNLFWLIRLEVKK